MLRLSFPYLRRISGSISAPAKNVSKMLPNPARKPIHSTFGSKPQTS